MVYLAMPVPQMDGSRFASSNCGPAVTSLLITQSSVDALKIGPQKIRNASGDTSGGIEGGLLASTANKLTNYLYPLAYTRQDDFSDVRTVLEHRSIALIIDCSETVTTKYRTNRFTGNHWVTLAGGSEKDGTVKVEDPGTTFAGWLRWPIDLLRRASDFGGYHFFLQGSATEDVNRHATRAVAVRAEPDRNSRRIGGLTKGDEVHVRKTTRGEMWRRADGTEARGWHVIDWKGGKGYVKGEGLR